MTCENYSSNNIPLGVGYDTNGNAKSFVELSAITVASVSAESYQGLPAGGDGTFSGLADVCYSPTATNQGDILLFDSTAGCWYTGPNAGGGGGSLPTGTTGDILVVPDGGSTAFAATDPASFITANKIITTADGTLNAYAQATSLNSYVPRTGSTTVAGPVSFVTNPVTFNGGVSKFSTGFEATGPATIEGNAIATQQYVQDNAAQLGSPNTFTQANTFQAGLNATGPLIFTGTATFTERPKIGGVNFAIATDLNSYVPTTTFYSTTATLTPTGTFYSTTATLLEKPSTGSDGDILLYSTGNDTAATGVAAFITDQNIVKTSDLGSYVTETEYDTSADLFTATGLFYTTTATLVTKDGFDGSAADFVTNVEYDTSADLFVATSITTTQSRAFLGTTTDIDALNNVITLDDGLADGDVLTYKTTAGGTWYNAPVAVKTLTFGNKSVTPGASGAYTVSNVVTVPPGFTGKGDTTVDSFIIFSGTDASSTEYVGTRWGANWVEGPQNIETTNGNYFAYVSATPTGDAPGSSGVAAIELASGVLDFIGTGYSAIDLSSLGDTNFTDLTQHQHIQWDGTQWLNAFEDEQYLRIRNETGSTLTKGQLVYVSGSHNEDVSLVSLAKADSATTMPSLGAVSENISNNADGLAVTFGKAKGLNTAAFNVGDTVYVSPTTAGEVTNTRPTGASELVQNVGVVTKSHATTGAIKVTGVGRSNDVPNSATFTGSLNVSGAATFAGGATFNSTAPQSTVTPAASNDLTTKTYVDTVDAAIIAGSVLTAIPVTISAKHTATGGISFTTVAPSSTVTPATNNDLTNKAYVDSVAGMPSSIATANTVDNDGSIATSLGVQRLPHVHGQFIWTRFKTAGTQSSAGNLTTLGNGITTASDIEIVKSIPDGASAGDNTLMSYTIATEGGGTAKWNVGDSQGIYKITLNAIIENSTSNPDTDINIKVNGTAVGGATDLFKTAGSWIAHQSRPASFEWVGLIRSSWDITIDATSAAGNTNFLAGTTVTITRIA